MAGDNQHFCLRWNKHQSTLISVFDTLLESGTLADCTLAAEGQYLKAHKVVLSACSPYLELLLSQHYEKHPIVILKDVKFQDLKSMMNYMYRGEVNISQDQFSTFLKAAESLQIKGLTADGVGNEDNTDTSAPAKAPVATPVRKSIQQSVTRGPSTVAQGLTIERSPESPHITSRDDSASSTGKRRRNLRRPSTSYNPDCHIDASNSCDVPLLQSGAQSGVGVPNIPTTIPKGAPLDDGDHETDNSRINNHDASVAEVVAGPKIEPTGELIEPKLEYLEDMNNEDSIEDLTLDDDDDLDNSIDMSRAGPSHDNSNICFNQWLMSGIQTTDKVFMNLQEAVGAHRDTQVMMKSKKVLAGDSENEFDVDNPEEVGDSEDKWAPTAVAKTPGKRLRPAKSKPARKKKEPKVSYVKNEKEIPPKKERGSKAKPPPPAPIQLSSRGRRRATKVLTVEPEEDSEDDEGEVGNSEDDWTPTAVAKTPGKRLRPAKSTPARKKKEPKVSYVKNEKEIPPKRERGSKAKPPPPARIPSSSRGRGRATKVLTVEPEEDSEDDEEEVGDDSENEFTARTANRIILGF